MTHMSSTQFHKQCSAIKQMSRYVDNRSLFVIFTQVEIVKSVHDKVLYLTLILELLVNDRTLFNIKVLLVMYGKEKNKGFLLAD